jgi:hypothetical protein
MCGVVRDATQVCYPKWKPAAKVTASEVEGSDLVHLPLTQTADPSPAKQRHRDDVTEGC